VSSSPFLAPLKVTCSVLFSNLEPVLHILPDDLLEISQILSLQVDETLADCFVA